MAFFTKRELIVILLLVILVLFISVFSFMKKDVKTGLDLDDVDTSDDDELELEEAEEYAGTIMVHISGQVYNPGLVELEDGSRVIDAVNKVGGLKKDADLNEINLAKKLEDEEKIYIPKIGEYDLMVDETTSSNSSSNSTTGNDKININTATKEELITLPGIGEVTANKIIEYRENNRFETTEDIQNVSGIGPKKFEDIKDLITVK